MRPAMALARSGRATHKERLACPTFRQLSVNAKWSPKARALGAVDPTQPSTYPAFAIAGYLQRDSKRFRSSLGH